jgi:histidinol-phosphatase (PHP family)
MLPQDYHIHTLFSPDSKAPMEVMCRAALATGIPEIGFTEHFDLHPLEERRDFFRPGPWFAELKRCREVFAGRLTLRAGIEIGEPHLFRKETQALLAAYPFDYCLGSLHWVGSKLIFDPDYFDRPADEAFREFFIELEHMTSVGGFDVLSHFDVPVRIGYGVYGEYDPRRYEDVIRPVLRNCIERNIALDVNAAALRGKANVLTPGVDILRWYKEMGGERVTLGSDSHRPDHVGAHLPEALAAIREAGLTHLTFFNQRRAELQPLK